MIRIEFIVDGDYGTGWFVIEEDEFGNESSRKGPFSTRDEANRNV